MSAARIAPDSTIGSTSNGQCFCVKFSNDSSLLATGYADGSVLVYDVASGASRYSLASKSTLPTTSVRFRPQKAASKTRNVLLSGGANGCVHHWHITSQKCLHLIEEEDVELIPSKNGHTFIERPYRNQVFCIDYKPDGAKFATAGKDYKVRVYDEATKTIVQTLSRGVGKSSPGHSNRVFSVKWHPLDENIILSAGWDNTVQVWDTRVEGAVRSIFGPHICGDAMDIDPAGGNAILTGSWRPEGQLQLWDLGTGAEMKTFEWPVGLVNKDPCLVYAAQFSPDGKLIAAGGSGANEMRMFDRRTGDHLATMGNLTSGVYSLDFSASSEQLALGCSNGQVHMLDVTKLGRGGGAASAATAAK